ncbi:MAG TPA: hypothetical protein VHK66_03785 [Microvirga sp.]|jgi:hypothetical protein|nr:hypothetical protein [Microvirga sp.]
MKATSLQTFVSRVAKAKRMSFADLRRLQRDVLPHGPTTRGEVEAIVALDRALTRADDGWRDYLLDAVRGFMTTSAATPEATRWLASILAAAPDRTAQAIALAAIEELVEVDDALRAVARMGAKRKPNAAACTTGLIADTISASPEVRPGALGEVSVTWGGVRLGAALRARARSRRAPVQGS